MDLSQPAPRVIDLTDAALARHRASVLRCAGCGDGGSLYRLIGSTTPLCRSCFAAVHVPQG